MPPVNISKGTTGILQLLLDITTEYLNDILNGVTGYQSMVIPSILETYVQIPHSQKYTVYFTPLKNQKFT